MKKFLQYLLSGTVLLIAVAAVAYNYLDYIMNPWTRDGQVRAEVIQITPRVTGPIVELGVKDKQQQDLLSSTRGSLATDLVERGKTFYLTIYSLRFLRRHQIKESLCFQFLMNSQLAGYLCHHY